MKNIAYNDAYLDGDRFELSKKKVFISRMSLAINPFGIVWLGIHVRLDGAPKLLDVLVGPINLGLNACQRIYAIHDSRQRGWVE